MFIENSFGWSQTTPGRGRTFNLHNFFYKHVMPPASGSICYSKLFFDSATFEQFCQMLSFVIKQFKHEY